MSNITNATCRKKAPRRPDPERPERISYFRATNADLILQCLHANGPMTGKEIAEKLLIPFNCISGVITCLRDEGLVARAGERRKCGKAVKITGTGQRVP